MLYAPHTCVIGMILLSLIEGAGAQNSSMLTTFNFINQYQSCSETEKISRIKMKIKYFAHAVLYS